MQIQISKENWSVDSVARKKDRIDLQPDYQRTPVWTKNKKQKLIDSILRGYDLPKFYLRSSNSKYEYEVVDGQQRLRAIQEFLNDDYPLPKYSDNITDFEDLSGKKWSDLTSPQQDRIGNFPLSVVIIKEAPDFEIRDLFLRLQEGVSLTPAEKRNAMHGNMRDFIVHLGDNLKVFELIKIPKTRFQHHDIAAIITCLELADGATEVKSPRLKRMYDNEKDFNLNGSEAKKIKWNLNYMARVLNDSPPEMDIKWGFVDLYLLISKLKDSYVTSGRENEFSNFYKIFENERRIHIKDHKKLLTDNSKVWDIELYNYIEAFIRTGGTKKNLEERHQVYIRRFLKETSNLVPKDPKRLFTYNERMVIWYRDGKKCRNCNNEIEFKEMHADHIMAHSKGGKTIIDNGQTLCRECNAKKGAA